MKNKIAFIDLPGIDIINKNIFTVDGNDFYDELFNISSSMIFITKGGEINTIENENTLNILKNTKLKEINEWNNNLKNKNFEYENNFLDSCLFVDNICRESNEEEINIENIQKEFYHLLFSSNNNNNYKKINTAIFDAKSYQEYLEIWNLFFKIQDLFKTYQKDFLNQLNISSYYNPLKEKNFPKYCLKQIKIKINNCSVEIEKNPEDDEYFYSEIKQIICSLMKEMKQKLENSDESLIKEISNLLKQVHLNIKTIKFYQESFCEDFFSKLSQQILLSNEYLNNQYIKQFIETLNIFSYIENNILEKKRKEIESENEKKINNLNSIKHLITIKNKLQTLFSVIKQKIHSSLENIKNNVDEQLKKFKNDNEKIIKEYFKNTIINNLASQKYNLNYLIKDLIKECKNAQIEFDIYKIFNIFEKNSKTEQFGEVVINYLIKFISSSKLLKPSSNAILDWLYFYFKMPYKEKLLNAISFLENSIDNNFEQKIILFNDELSFINNNQEEIYVAFDMQTKKTNEKINQIDKLIEKLSVISNQFINEDI